jgi:hypothetical protein
MDFGIMLLNAGKLGHLSRDLVLDSVMAHGTAGTGAPIASLHGAAALDAALARLGRGPQALGGGGKPAGEAVLAIVKAAPAVIIGGAALTVGAVKTVRAVKARAQRRAEAEPEQGAPES